MEVRKPKEWESFPELREVKNTQETKKQKEGFSMMKGGKSYTIADIEALPEGERAELIDGEFFWMDAPVRRHQKILIELTFAIKLYIKEKKGHCELYPAPFAVHIKRDNQNYVEPDISIVCDKTKLDEKGCQGAPDWMIEIVSPSSKRMDCERKVNLYREAGAREYWIVDPDTEIVTVYDFGNDKKMHGENGKASDAVCGFTPVQYSFSERIKVGIFKDLWLCLAEMDVS